MGSTLPPPAAQAIEPNDVLEEDGAHTSSHDAEHGEASEIVQDEKLGGVVGRSDRDSSLVEWDEAGLDPANPMQWPAWKKWVTIAIISFMTFLTPLASSMLAPAVPDILDEFDVTSTTYATFVVSIFVLGFAVGPLIIAPLSEIYGRLPIYNVSNILFVVFSVMCAIATDPGMLLAARFLAGFVGVASVTCGAGSISDMLPIDQRGRALSLWSMGPMFGPIVGPIAGGFLVTAKGWRWIFWVTVILSSFITIVAALLLRETYAPVILGRKVAKLKKRTGNPLLHSKYTSNAPTSQLVVNSITRPIKMLITYPIVTLMCLYVAFLYGALYILFTTFTFVFEDQYGFSASAAGLSFLGSGLGSLAGLAYGAKFSDKVIRKKQAIGRTPVPEDRLPLFLTLPASMALPIGLFVYGWSAEFHVHWIVPEIGTAITSFGMLTMLMCIQAYLVDAYTLHAASVIAANASLRSALGGLLPLCGLKLYDAMGLGWGNSLLAFIAMAMAPLPIVFRLYGARLRQSSFTNDKTI